MRSGVPYQTRLDPPPGDSRVAHPPRPGEAPGHWTDPPPSPTVAASQEPRPAHASATLVAARSEESPAAAPVPPPSRPAGQLTLGGVVRSDAWRAEKVVDSSEVVLGMSVRHPAFGHG
jgi:hypothetical protein